MAQQRMPYRRIAVVPPYGMCSRRKSPTKLDALYTLTAARDVRVPLPIESFAVGYEYGPL